MITAIGLSLFMAGRMTKTILFSLQKIAEVIESMSDGNLTKRIEVVWKDEIGEIAAHLNVFAEKLWNTFIQFSKGSIVASSTATMLDNAARQMTSGIEESVVQVNSVATASEEMSTTSSEIAQNCVSAAKSSEKANGAALPVKRSLMKRWRSWTALTILSNPPRRPWGVLGRDLTR